MNVYRFIHSSIRRALRYRRLARFRLPYWLWHDRRLACEIGTIAVSTSRALVTQAAIKPVKYGFWIPGERGAGQEAIACVGAGPSGFHARMVIQRGTGLILTAWGEPHSTQDAAFSEAEQMVRDWRAHPGMLIDVHAIRPFEPEDAFLGLRTVSGRQVCMTDSAVFDEFCKKQAKHLI